MYKDIGLCLTLKHSDYLAADKSNKKGGQKICEMQIYSQDNRQSSKIRLFNKMFSTPC